MPSRARGDVAGHGESGQGALPHDDRVNELDGDVLGIRAPSAVAERDQLAAPLNLAAVAAPALLIASAHAMRARPASRRRAKASAPDPKTTGPDRAAPTPLTDAPPSVAPEKDHRPRVGRGRVANTG